MKTCPGRGASLIGGFNKPNQNNYTKMKKFKYRKRREPYLPSLIRPSEIKIILKALNISWPDKSVKPNGWVTIQSPFRQDRKPSFSINIKHGGFSDHAHPDCKGDIVSLVMLAHNYDKHIAKIWIAKTINLNSKITIQL